MSETPPTRYLITGAGGMLGTAFRTLLEERRILFEAYTHAELDIADDAAVEETLTRFARAGETGCVINAAAYTDVESAEADRDAAFQVNETAARLLASVAATRGLRLVHMSTDYVFDGTKGAPYVEDDPVCPLSVYGASKLAGERAVLTEMPEALVVRTSWVYGPPSGGFPGRILRAARAGESLSVLEDEVGSPTYSMDLADGILALLEAGAEGLYHLCGTGSCSRYEFATEIVRLGAGNAQLVPADTASRRMRAIRPKYSVLDTGKAAADGVVLPGWRAALERCWASGDCEQMA